MGWFVILFLKGEWRYLHCEWTKCSAGFVLFWWSKVTVMWESFGGGASALRGGSHKQGTEEGVDIFPLVCSWALLQMTIIRGEKTPNKEKHWIDQHNCWWERPYKSLPFSKYWCGEVSGIEFWAESWWLLFGLCLHRPRFWWWRSWSGLGWSTFR